MAARLGETTYKAWHALYCFCALGLVEPADGSVLAGSPRSLGVNRAEPIQMPVRGPWPAATAGRQSAPTLRSCDAPPDQAAARRDTASEHAATARRGLRASSRTARRGVRASSCTAETWRQSKQLHGETRRSEQAVARRNTPSWQRAELRTADCETRSEPRRADTWSTACDRPPGATLFHWKKSVDVGGDYTRVQTFGLDVRSAGRRFVQEHIAI